MDELWLAGALRAAKASGASGRELRRLQWQAFESSRGVALGGPGGGCLQRLEEEVLVAVAAGSGVAGRISVPEAKTTLRRCGPGGRHLASRLGRLSRGRNAQAHPDVGLVGEVAGILRPADGEKPAAAAGEPAAAAGSAAAAPELEAVGST